MTYQEAAGLVRNHFESQWGARVPTVKYSYRNGPRIHEALDPEIDSWVEFGVLDNFSEISAIGQRLRRQFSRVHVDIYTPLGRGDGRSRSYGDIIADIWDIAMIPGILLEAPEFVPGGPNEELPWWTDACSTPFVFMHNPSVP